MRSIYRIVLSVFLCFAILVFTLYVDYQKAQAVALSVTLGVTVLAGMLVGGGYLIYKNWDKVYPLLYDVWNELEDNVKDAILVPVNAGKSYVKYGPVVWSAVLNSLVNNKDQAKTAVIDEAKEEKIPFEAEYYDGDGVGYKNYPLKVGNRYQIKFYDYNWRSYTLDIYVLDAEGPYYYCLVKFYRTHWLQWERYVYVYNVRVGYDVREEPTPYLVQLDVYWVDERTMWEWSAEGAPEFIDCGIVVDTVYDPSDEDVQVVVPVGNISQEANKASKKNIHNPGNTVVDTSTMIGYLKDLENVDQEIYNQIYDLEQEQTNILSAIRSMIGTIVTGIGTLVGVFTDGLVGDLAIDYAPLMDLPITTKFPFSLPFDLYNAVVGFSSEGDLPELNFGFYDPVNKTIIDNRIDLESIGFVVEYAPYVRAVLLFVYVLGLIYATRRLLGGGV